MLAVAAVALCAAGGVVFYLPDREGVPRVEPHSTPAGIPANTAGEKAGAARSTPAILHMRESLPPKVNIPVAADHFSRWVRDEDFVVGVQIGEEARCYPLNALHDPAHEVLNDTLGGKPIGVTWCSLCQSPVVFDRMLDGNTLTIFASGGLAERNMVLQDVETRSEWVQILGEAVSGPLKGKHLEVIPALWTDWKTWRTKYPQTTVAAIPSRVPIYRHVDRYADFPAERDYFDKFQWGLAHDDEARSWPFSRLATQPVVNDSFGGRALLLCFDQHTSSVTAFDRRLEGRELTFRMEGSNLVDAETGSAWDPVTGRCTRGLLLEKQLQRTAGTVCTDKAWASFYPESEVWTPSPVPFPGSRGTGNKG